MAGILINRTVFMGLIKLKLWLPAN